MAGSCNKTKISATVYATPRHASSVIAGNMVIRPTGLNSKRTRTASHGRMSPHLVLRMLRLLLLNRLSRKVYGTQNKQNFHAPLCVKLHTSPAKLGIAHSHPPSQHISNIPRDACGRWPSFSSWLVLPASLLSLYPGTSASSLQEPAAVC